MRLNIFIKEIRKLKFRVTISISSKSTYLGSFDTLEEAQQAYNDRKLSYIESKSN